MTSIPRQPNSPLDLSCPTCGSPMTNLAGTEILRCSACGTTRAMSETTAVPVASHTYEDWVRTAAGRSASDLGGVVLRCEGCHATTEQAAVSDRCAFCASPLVPVAAPEGVLSPTGIVPFTLSRAQAQQIFLDWLHAKEITPDSIAEVNAAEQLTSVFVPWWLVTGRATTRYEGRSGRATVVGYEDEDRLREILRWTWTDASGTTVRDVVGAPVGAAHLTDEVRRLLKGTEITGARDFRPEFVAGHQVSRYDVEPQVAVDETARLTAPVITSDIKRTIDGDAAEVTQQLTAWSDVRLALVLTPVWLITFHHEGRVWNVAIDDRTSRVNGEFPLDKAKVAKAFAGCFAQLALAVAVAAVAMWAWIKFF